VVKVVLSVALVVGAAVYLLGGSLSGALVYDRTVDEVIAERATLMGAQLRVGGRLVPGSLRVRPGTTTHEFAIQGVGQPLEVRYSGLWPDAAAEGRELMVEGALGQDGVVEAERVLARCPSRYKRRVE
jgi:cytochrome c-type biogenesis protein CcmE